MLDIMRRKQRGLKFVLWIVIIGLGMGMLILFVDVGGQSSNGLLNSNQVVASVDGLDISAGRFQRAYFDLLDRYRRQFGIDSSSNAAMLKALRPGQVVLDQLIKDTIVRNEAAQMGLDVSQGELLAALRKMPNISENGRFLGRARLEQLLRANNLTLAEFEANLNVSLLSQKVRSVITDGIDVSEEEIREDFLESSQKAKIDYVVFKPEDSLSEVAVVESELEPFFEKNKERYRVDEKRRIRYLQINPSDFRSKVKISEQDLRSTFDAEGDQTEVRARHILFKIEDPANELAVRTRAEAVLAEARQGKDFAELARANSDDEGSASRGGDLGFFKRGQMVPEFSNVAFGMEPGDISDLVKSQYGFHIIKVEEKRTQKFEEKRAQLEFQLRGQRAELMAREKADEAAARLKIEGDIEKLSKEMKLDLRESGLFGISGVIPVLGQIPGLQPEVFDMQKVGDVGTPHKGVLGFIVPQLAEIKASSIPDFKDVRSSVIADYKEEKAIALAEAKARRFAASLKGNRTLSSASGRSKIPVISPPPFTRRSNIDDTLLRTQAVIDQAFSLPIGRVGEVAKVDEMFIVFQVKSRDEFDTSGYAAQKDDIRNRLAAAKRSNFFQAYLQNLDQQLRKEQKILINQRLIDQIVG